MIFDERKKKHKKSKIVSEKFRKMTLLYEILRVIIPELLFKEKHWKFWQETIYNIL